MAPAGGSYDVYVDLFAGAAEQVVKLNHWQLNEPAGNLTATPASQAVTTATQLSLTAAWSNLTAGTRYLGRLNYTDGADGSGTTLIRIAS